MITFSGTIPKGCFLICTKLSFEYKFKIDLFTQVCIYNRMDISRSILDNLMGRERNLPKNSTQSKDHYSNSDVCKPFLICFCFNTLFPNTIYDDGPCNKRHDTYLKTMFDNDLNRGEFEKQYIKECISWIQRRLQEVEQKTKKNQSTIQNKTNSSTQRPRQIVDRLMAYDQDIEEMMRQAAVFGENGQIDDSARCLQEVQRLRERRKEVDLMGDNLLAVIKHQKICEICGAIQTINDTEKRIQMHLQGKIHQGFLRLRTEIDTLKIRLEILQSKLDKNKEKNQPLAIAPAETPRTTEPPKADKNVVSQKQKPSEKQKEKEHREKERNQRDRSHSRKKKKQHKNRDERGGSKEKKKKDRHDQKYDGDLNQKSRSRSKHKKEKKDKKRKSYSRDRDHRRAYE